MLNKSHSKLDTSLFFLFFPSQLKTIKKLQQIIKAHFQEDICEDKIVPKLITLRKKIVKEDDNFLFLKILIVATKKHFFSRTQKGIETQYLHSRLSTS